MTKKDMKPLAEILDFLAEGLGTEMTAVKHRFYYAALSDLTIEDIKLAANRIARTATFFPKPAEFREHIIGDKDTMAIEAWVKAHKSINMYQSVQFDDPVIHSTIEAMGGWVKFCQSEGYSDETWKRKDFEKIYKSLVGVARESPLYLTGLTELENNARGLNEFIKPPKFIGDESKRIAIECEKVKALPAGEGTTKMPEETRRALSEIGIKID